MLGLTFAAVSRGVAGDKNDALIFVAEDGRTFSFYHDQDCCEGVCIEDIAGDLQDLVGAPLLAAEETGREATADEVSETGAWTFYNFRTVKGAVTVRWLGQS